MLYIAEKPSVAKAIASELGIASRSDASFTCRDGSIVTWCFGHLLEQAEPDAYLPDTVPLNRKGRKIWRLQDLPILPAQWLSNPRTDRGVKKQLTAIGKLIRSRDVSVIVNAGDPDREGQLLVDEVLEHFRCAKPVKRFWVSAVDPASIRKGLRDLRENADYAGMRDAARGRSRADWLLGMNLSRAYTLTNTADQLIAVGRVQTPTLAMVARRDYAVRNFVPVPYLSISADLEAKAVRFRARWKPKAGQPGLDEDGKLLIDLEIGRKLVERLRCETTAQVISSTTKRRKALQPKCYSLADIQIEASRFYGFSAEQTLRICQSLYETHKITSYPRTDCGYLPESQHADAKSVLAAVAKTCPASAPACAKADTAIKSPTFNDKKVTAHHGIVPVANTADWTRLSPDEQKLYRLIAKRYIANFFPAHEYDATEILFDIGGETFSATGKSVVKKGWKVLYERAAGKSSGDETPAEPDKPGAKTSAGDDEDADQALPALTKGETADVLAVTGREDKTKPPTYFTEGTLIAAMENVWRSFDDPHLQEKLKEAGGIGTPATRASILQELKRKSYLYAEGKYLHCSEEGRAVLLKASPKVRSAAMTAAFEAKLGDVERGRCSLTDFVAEYEAFIREEIEKAKQSGRTPSPAGDVPVEFSQALRSVGEKTTARTGTKRTGSARSPRSSTRTNTKRSTASASSGTASAAKSTARTKTATKTVSRSSSAAARKKASPANGSFGRTGVPWSADKTPHRTTIDLPEDRTPVPSDVAGSDGEPPAFLTEGIPFPTDDPAWT